jgi:hypothetical protein
MKQRQTPPPKVNKTKIWFFEKINKLDKSLANLTKMRKKECKSGYNKVTCTPMFIAALFTIVKLWK